jgi:hypothetical protein
MAWLARIVVACGLMLAGLVAAQASVVARVDLAQQRMQVFVDGALTHEWAVSTGRAGFRTPTGAWSAKRAHRHWHSRKYDAPMPYAVFFSGGYAIHATSEVRRLGRPASHGCVRLAPGNAATFYNLVRERGVGATRVVINQGASDLPVVASTKARAKVAATSTKARSKVAVAAAKAKPSKPQAVAAKPGSIPVLGYAPVSLKASGANAKAVAPWSSLIRPTLPQGTR